MTSRTTYYKTVSQVFKFDDEIESHKNQPSIQLVKPSSFVEKKKEEQEEEVKKEEVKKEETFYVPKETFYIDKIEDYETYYSMYQNTSSKKGNLPEVFGPPLWFSLHNASAYYPTNASPLHAERMKNIILGIPVLLPCETCKEHATNYIEEKKHLLSDICKTKEALFEFFVDFHNYVNERLGKPFLSYKEAERIYI